MSNGTMAATEATDTATRIDDGEALRKRGRDLADQCANLRGKLRTLTERRGTPREALARAVSAFMSGVGPRVSDAQLRRDYLASAQKEREAAKNAPAYEPPPVANSFIDRVAQGTGDASTFVRKQLRTGHRRDAARFVGLRGAKLPSNR
jgi:hypothetical protein